MSRRGRGSKGKGRGGGEEEVHGAARSGDMVALKSILSSNPPPSIINSRDSHSRTPLHLAAWSGQAEAVSYLCNHKADVGAAAMDDMGAIHFAAQKGHLEVVRILLSSGASVKACTRKGFTPLHYAVQGSHLDLVKYLVKKGASLTVKTKAGQTPLGLAGSEEVRLFLEELEQSSKKKKKDTHQMPEAEDTPKNADMETDAPELGEVLEDENVKRKGEGDDANEASPEPKRARVKLNHLLSADDDATEE